MFVVQKDALEQTPTSILEQCVPSIYALDRRMIMLDLQYLKNTESFILMKNIHVPHALLDKYEK